MHTWMRAYFNLYRNISEFLWVINPPVKAIGFFFLFFLTNIYDYVHLYPCFNCCRYICKLPHLRVQVHRVCNTDYNVNLL